MENLPAYIYIDVRLKAHHRIALCLRGNNNTQKKARPQHTEKRTIWFQFGVSLPLASFASPPYGYVRICAI